MRSVPDPNEPTGSSSEHWLHYRQLEWLDNHWDRPGWEADRRSYHWFVTFTSEAGLAKLAVMCQARLADMPTLDLVPLDRLHLTLDRVAFVDEISVPDLDEVVRQSRRKCQEVLPFDVHIGPLAGSKGAVSFSVGPRRAVEGVRAKLRDVLSDVLGPESLRDKPFRPHVSIAYNREPVPAGQIISEVADLRSLGSASASVDRIRLVELRREGRSYAWDDVAVLALGL